MRICRKDHAGFLAFWLILVQLPVKVGIAPGAIFLTFADMKQIGISP